MSGVGWSYEQVLGLGLLKAAAQNFVVEIEKEHVFDRLKIDPFSKDLARRMVEIIFGVFPEIEEDFLSEFEQTQTKGTSLGSDHDIDLPF